MSTTGQIPTRDKVPQHLTWDLTTIFATDDDWTAEYEALQQAIPQFEQYKGTLGDGAANLLAVLQFQDAISERLGKLYTYAHMRYDEDTTNSHYQGMNQKVESLVTYASSAMSYIVPEILKIEEKQLNQFLAENEPLRLYEKTLDEISRQREHTLSEKEESLLSQAADALQTASTT